MKKAPYVVIMAGGVGSRFWPMSRTALPKQFIDFFGTGRSLLQQTYDRFVRLSPPENIYVVSNRDYDGIIRQQLPMLPPENILLEPMRRNTAPCIAYANRRIALRDAQANIVVSPADHLVLNPEQFEKDMRSCLAFVEKNDALVTLGISPSRPETGYGYIQVEGAQDSFGKIVPVKTFTEKPNHEMAQLFVDSKEFFWNSGMFVWNLQSIEKAFDMYLPQVQALFKKNLDAYQSPDEANYIESTYTACNSISIDYGIMEHTSQAFVLCTDFGWSDLGTWGSLHDNSPRDEHNNASIGPQIELRESHNCIVQVQGDKLALVQGLDGYIVVDAPDALLICKRHDEQKLRHYVMEIEQSYGKKYS